MEELRTMFSQYMQSQTKSKSKHGHGSNRKTKHNRDLHSQREEGMCSNPCYNSYQSPSK